MELYMKIFIAYAYESSIFSSENGGAFNGRKKKIIRMNERWKKLLGKK